MSLFSLSLALFCARLLLWFYVSLSIMFALLVLFYFSSFVVSYFLVFSTFFMLHFLISLHFVTRGGGGSCRRQWKSAAPLGARAEGFGELVRGAGGFYKIF